MVDGRLRCLGGVGDMTPFRFHVRRCGGCGSAADVTKRHAGAGSVPDLAYVL